VDRSCRLYEKRPSIKGKLNRLLKEAFQLELRIHLMQVLPMLLDATEPKLV